MKDNGIGRPSSRAGIIETLLKRRYVRREKKALISNSAGRDLISVIQAPLLKSPELTGLWEKKLRDIEKGTFTLESFMSELQDQLVAIIKAVGGDTSGRRITAEESPAPTKSRRSSSRGTPSRRTVKPVYSDVPVKEGDKCPICGKGTVRKGPYGLFCSDYKTSGCRLKNK